MGAFIYFRLMETLFVKNVRHVRASGCPLNVKGLVWYGVVHAWVGSPHRILLSTCNDIKS